jgi:RimJ/RimL family protein N-acetyltransferase
MDPSTPASPQPGCLTTGEHHGDLVRAGQRVALHRHVPSNLPAFQRWYADPDIAWNLRHDLSPLNERQAKSYFETLILPLSARGFCWALVERATGGLIGTSALTEVDARRGSALFRIVIGERDRWGAGLGTEATRLVVEEGFGAHRLRRIDLEVFAHNDRARATYARVGFRQTGDHTEHVRQRDVDLHVLEMSLARADYDALGTFASTSPAYAGS